MSEQGMPERDACQVCHGEKGGVPGNENIVNGVVMCDYCHAEDMRKRGVTGEVVYSPEIPERGHDGLTREERMQQMTRPVDPSQAWVPMSQLAALRQELDTQRAIAVKAIQDAAEKDEQIRNWRPKTSG